MRLGRSSHAHPQTEATPHLVVVDEDALVEGLGSRVTLLAHSRKPLRRARPAEHRGLDASREGDVELSRGGRQEAAASDEHLAVGAAMAERGLGPRCCLDESRYEDYVLFFDADSEAVVRESMPAGKVALHVLLDVKRAVKVRLVTRLLE